MKNSPPPHLSKDARKWWAKIVREYSIDDEAGRLLLQTSLEAFDRMKEAQRRLDQEGLTYKDRFEQVKPHPLIPVERDARAALFAGLKSLNLDLEPLRDGPGRPPGR